MTLRRGSHSPRKVYRGKHRFEHWYRDNQAYFITARCRGRYPAFTADAAKEVFWDRFEHWVSPSSFTPWIVSLMDNHYHMVGYLKHGADLPPMMQRLHGSVAKLVNDQLAERLRPFWVERGHQNYFDGCVRDERQAGLAYRYVLTQCRRHGICDEPAEYPHTRVFIDADRAIHRCTQLNGFLRGVPYKRY